MAKVIDIEKLKAILSEIVTPENETSTIEKVMADSYDYDEEAINSRIEEAVKTAREEESRVYAEKVHNMFFGDKAGYTEKSVDDEKSGVFDEESVDDRKVDVQETNKTEVEDIFTYKE